MARYYDRSTRTEVPAPKYDPLNSMHIELPPEHIFWQPLPSGQRLTYDLNDIPNGYEPIPVSVETLIVQDLLAQGVTINSMTKALWANQFGSSTELNDIDATIQAIAFNRGVLAADVLAVLGGG